MKALPWRWVLPAIALKVALNLSVADRYGWHRDELYYRDAGLHPAAGYVDFPPVTAWLARLSHAPFTDRLVQKFGLSVEGWRGSADPAITMIDTPA